MTRLFAWAGSGCLLVCVDEAAEELGAADAGSDPGERGYLSGFRGLEVGRVGKQAVTVSTGPGTPSGRWAMNRTRTG